jgi:hypothetical protein
VRRLEFGNFRRKFDHLWPDFAYLAMTPQPVVKVKITGVSMGSADFLLFRSLRP